MILITEPIIVSVVAVAFIFASVFWRGRKVEVIQDHDVEHIWQMRKSK